MEERDIQYWKDCLSRVDPKDTFSIMLITGKIKQLYREKEKEP